MKKIILALIFVLPFGFCKADYEPTTLTELIDKSQLIIECKIANVLADAIEVEVLEVIKGDTALTKILVNKFENWACASRWATYQKGQTEMMFLMKDPKTGKWVIMGAGNEGEMPIADGFLYCGLDLHSDRSRKKLTLNDAVIYGIEFDLADSKSDIKEYLENEKRIKKLLENNKSDEYQTENLFIKSIIGELNDFKN